MTKFFISFYERTGSTMLCHILNNHPDIKCGFELLATPQERITNNEAIPVEDSLNEISKYYAISKHHTIGFKFKYPNQHNYYADVTKYLYHNDEIKTIFLYRKNAIKQYVSKLNQLVLNKKYKEANSNRKKDIPKIFFDDQKKEFAYQYMSHYMISTKVIHKVLSQKHNTFMITYEDLYSNTEQTVRSICDFLKVDFKNNMINNIKVIKISDNNIDNNFVNPSEFTQYIQSIGFDIFLTENPEIHRWPPHLVESIFDLQEKIL